VVFILQLTSFLAFIFGFKALKRTMINFTDPLTKPSRGLLIGLLIPTVISYVSGVIAFLEYKQHPGSQQGTNVLYLVFLNLSNIIDVIRYLQLMVITLILYQILQSFPAKMKSFNLPMIFQNDAHRDYGDIIQFESMNHKLFKKSFNRMIGKYQFIMKEFQSFLMVLFICNVLTWICSLWNVQWRADVHDVRCTTKAWLEYIHFALEILFFVWMWMVLIWRLKDNQTLIRQYRDDFNLYMVTEDERKSYDMMIISQYLNTITEHRSPFKIYGFAPTPSKIAWLISVILGPMTYNVIRYAKEY